MSDTILNRRDIEFLLYEVLNAESVTQFERYSEHSRETFDAVLNTAESIATDLMAPHNAKADEHEPTFDGEKVTMIPEVKVAFDALAEAGFIAGHMDYDEGGMQLPSMIMSACMGYFAAANVGTAAYPLLTSAAANLIRTFGSDEQKRLYMGSMASGRFAGTMALTEPHAGSSLADITTTATPADDGTYRIKGNKIYISGGDQALTENIVHMVLAKIKGAPAGVKGISLFIVPKFLVDENGNPTTRNDVALAGLFHKMGYRGTTSTALNFGEKGGAVGYLVGEPHNGLKYMFQMMNEARVGVGLGAAALGYQGYVHSLGYAKERPQGRHIASNDPASKPVPIIQHADVRRMLLAQKAYAEGALHLCLFGARLVDEGHCSSDEAEKQEAQLLLDLLTPIIKSWPSEYGPKANDLAIQIYGGAGYTREYPVEQCYRDNRLNPIHEGTQGIQGLDLLGRKIWQKDSAGLKALAARMQADIKTATGMARCDELAKTFGAALHCAVNTTTQLGGAMMKEGPEKTLANANSYLAMMGHVVVAWLWIKQAIAAEQALPDAKGSDADFYQGKLQAAQYFMRWELPGIYPHAELLKKLDDTCLTMQEGWF